VKSAVHAGPCRHVVPLLGTRSAFHRRRRERPNALQGPGATGVAWGRIGRALTAAVIRARGCKKNWHNEAQDQGKTLHAERIIKRRAVAVLAALVLTHAFPTNAWAAHYRGDSPATCRKSSRRPQV
jgi:hypothetical protein